MTEVVDVTSCGAKGDGVTDDTAAIQAAINTGGPVMLPPPSVRYRITQPLTFNTPGQMIFGFGRKASQFLIDPSFAMSAAGIFIAQSGEPGPIFQDFGLFFTQPDTATRSALVAYPPAFYLNGQPRTQWRSVGIYAGITGISLVNNCGGVYIDDLQSSCFSNNVLFSGPTPCEDSVRISRPHIWNFDLTPNQVSIFCSADTDGVNIASGGVNDLHITDGLILVGGEQISVAAGTNSWGEIVNTGFDSYGSLNIGGGFWSLVGGYFSQAAGACISLTGGELRATGVYFQYGTPGTPCVSVAGSPVAYATFDACRFAMGSADASAVLVSAPAGTAAQVGLNNNRFERTPNIAYTQPTVNVPALGGSARLTAMGNRMTDKGSGAGTFFNIGADDWHRIIGNAPVGWSNTFPTPGVGVYQWN